LLQTADLLLPPICIQQDEVSGWRSVLSLRDPAEKQQATHQFARIAGPRPVAPLSSGRHDGETGSVSFARPFAPSSGLNLRSDVFMSDQSPVGEFPPVTELSKRQRRVLGVLVEKAFTTPEYYPLTLKAATAGCNQKSNRDPVASYTEDDVQDVLDELRELGLAGVVHTASGRTERFRHYLRHRMTLTEPQLAILTELLLRGRQSLGELRSRAGRMATIDSLGTLRDELRGLIDLGLVQAGGQLERRGVEVDHNLYWAGEAEEFPQTTQAASAPASSVSVATESPVSAPKNVSAAAPSLSDETATRLESEIKRLRDDNRTLRDDIESLRESVDAMQATVDELRPLLG
jgi:uncharacterized protein YceH (UPF0502 family)